MLRKSGLRPEDLLKALKKQAEARKKHFAGKTVVPDTYTLRLGKEDFRELRPILQSLEAELRQELEQYCRKRNYGLQPSGVRLTLALDRNLENGEIGLDCCFAGSNQGRFSPEAASKPKGTDPNGSIRPVRLKILSQTGEAEQRIVGQGSHTLGRGRQADILIESDPRVSKLHCCLKVDGKQVMLQDRQSTNGSFLNGRLVQKAVLAPGDCLLLGTTRIEVHW